MGASFDFFMVVSTHTTLRGAALAIQETSSSTGGHHVSNGVWRREHAFEGAFVDTGTSEARCRISTCGRVQIGGRRICCRSEVGALTFNQLVLHDDFGR
jgi:hypothetical protein